MAKFCCFWKTSDQESPPYIRKYQLNSKLFEKGLKSGSTEDISEYGRSQQQCDNESQIQPRHKYYRNSNHHRIVQRRKSI